MTELTPKQDAFALAYVESGNAAAAYRSAYDVGPETKPETVWSEASRTLADPKVAARVMELQDQARERTMVTVEILTAKLEEARVLAMSDEKGASAAVSAIMGMAKLHGLGIERKEVSGRPGAPLLSEVVHTLDDASVAKLMALVE